MFRPLRTAFIGLAATCALLPATALAGTYSVTQTVNSDSTGWSFAGDPGFQGCSNANGNDTCSSLAAPRALWVVGAGAADAGATGAWVWTAPPGVSIASGTVSVYYTTGTKNTETYLQTATAGQTLATQPRQFESKGAATTTWAIPQDTTQFGVALSNPNAVTFPSGLQNVVKVTKLQATLQDNDAPTLSATQVENAANGNPCIEVDAADSGAGVASVQLYDTNLAVLASTGKLRAQSALQPGAATVQQNLCFDPSKLVNGDALGQVIATDAAGNSVIAPILQSAAVTTAGPGLIYTFPASGGITNHLTDPIQVALNGGTGGLKSASATLDNNQTLTLNKGASESILTFLPSTPISIGTHTVRWNATDNAGNKTSGSFTFTAYAGPQVSATGALVSGQWFNASTASQCATVTVSDAASAIAEVDVSVPGKFITSFAGPAAGKTVTHNVCFKPSSVGSDLSTRLAITATDALGLIGQTNPIFEIDSTPPVLMRFGPTGNVTSNTTLSLTYRDALSGLKTASFAVDGGTPVTLTGGSGFSAPETYSVGTHTVTWTLTDNAGNVSTGRWSFTVTS